MLRDSLQMDVTAVPGVSVLLPVLNGGTYLDTAVSSILAQTFTDFEFLILVDERCSDDSLALAEQWAARDPRVRHIHTPPGAIGAALNHGFAQARGKYIALMEADDFAHPRRFQLQLAYMQQSGCDVCGTSAKLFGDEDTLFWFPAAHAAIRVELLFRCALHPATVMLRREVLEQQPFDPESVFQDYELWTRLVLHDYQLANIPRILAKIRIHAQQSQKTKKEKITETTAAIKMDYIRRLFPQAAAPVVRAMQNSVRKKSQASLGDLEFAARWMLELSSDAGCAQVRRLMARRWYAACLRSADLGMGVYDLYIREAAKFGTHGQHDLDELRTACSGNAGEATWSTVPNLEEMNKSWMIY